VLWILILEAFFGAEQDEGLEKLEETVLSTKHIALAVNEELSLHTRLIVCSPPILIFFGNILWSMFLTL
jgi:hypothetical protein